MMRHVLVGFSDEDMQALDTLSQIKHVSRAELIRQAVSMYIEKFKPEAASEEAFGLWRMRKIEGLAYQEKLREEW